MCRQNTQQMEWLESSCSKIKSTQTCKVQRNQLITQCSNFQTQFLSLTEWHVSFANQNWDHLRMIEPAQDDLSLTCWITYELSYVLNSPTKTNHIPNWRNFFNCVMTCWHQRHGSHQHAVLPTWRRSSVAGAPPSVVGGIDPVKQQLGWLNQIDPKLMRYLALSYP